MSLSPAALEDERRVGGVQCHVETAVDGVRVADLAVAGAVEGCLGEKARSVRFETGCTHAESFGVQVGHLSYFARESCECCRAAFLSRLSVRCDTGDLWARAETFWHAVEVAGVRVEDAGDWCGSVRVFESEEAEETDAEIAWESAGCTARTKTEKGGVVFVNEVACW